LASGFLEELLRCAILSRLADNKSSKSLFGDDSTFGLTILAKYAHALGLIGAEEFDALKKLARARNAIAHSWSTDFTTPAVQKIARSIQFVVIQGENEMAEHQKCFARLDYLGVYLTEELLNRFEKTPPTVYEGGNFAGKLVVQPRTGKHEFTIAPS